ncbi:MAG: hypothetical protein HYW25_04810 [Candidatus Aenigmarchaeota archaeon]|nr:hypothetical protein [Candidatus Aenigmarchaeota archaeon]
MGIFDEVEFRRYCPKCEAVTAWTAQFKWEHNCLHRFKEGDRLQKAFRHMKKAFRDRYGSLGRMSFVYNKAPASCTICEKKFRAVMETVAGKWLKGNEDLAKRVDSIDRIMESLHLTHKNLVKWDVDVIVRKGRIKVSYKEIPKSWRKRIEGAE